MTSSTRTSLSFISFRMLPAAVIAALLLCQITAHGGEFSASDGTIGLNQYFGYSTALSGSIAVAGAAENANSGSAYVFRNVTNFTGFATEAVKLRPLNGNAGDYFGYGVSLSGTSALVGASNGDHTITDQGAAYLYRNLDTATGTVTENVKLVASDGAASDQFGTAVALSGSLGLVGANTADGTFTNSGAAYVYRGLDTASGTVTQNAKLVASDVTAANHSFGVNVSLSGTTGLVAALGGGAGGANAGSVYLYRGLDTATGTVTESAKLTASDNANNDLFGFKLSHSGNTALISAYEDDDNGTASGSVYLFRNLDTATGTVTQDAKLTASDAGSSDSFGYSVAISGNNGIVGAINDDDKASNAGAAYIYTGLDTATSATKEDVKIVASTGASQDNFGFGIALDGDNFVVSSQRGTGADSNTGNAYSGSISSITTLDVGNTSRTIDGISFTSRRDWTIGATTDNNQVTLTVGDSATVTTANTYVRIGAGAGSDDNLLTIAGAFRATTVAIGAQGINEGNALRLDATATLNIGSILLADGSQLILQGDYSGAVEMLAYLGSTQMNVWNENAWETVNAGNFEELLETGYDAGTGYTSIQAVGAIPEPSAIVMIAGACGAFTLRRRRSR